MTWYNSYRPKSFDDVVGQDLIKTIMKNSIEMDKTKHAYLLSGPHGVGKTTLARIFASELNNLSEQPEGSMDIIEMDAASHTSIEDIRNLIDSSRTSPMIARFKIFIIDEVHMLSKPAMNALLKVLEEPPQYLIFLLATTNPEKLIETVLSRVSHLKLHAHSQADIVKRLEYISKTEGVNITNEALELIAEQAKGSQRDAINLLETVSSNNLDQYSGENVAALLGLAQKSLLLDISQQILSQSLTSETIQEIQSTGLDGTGLLAQMLTLLCKKSLAGDKSFDPLIPVIATVLGQKLPLPEAALALAVLQSTLNDNPPQTTVIQQSAVSSPHAKPAVTVRESKPDYQPEVNPKPRENPVIQKTSTTSESQQQTEPSQPAQVEPIEQKPIPADTIQTELNEQQIYQALARLQQEKDTPPTFKMILPDIEVGESQDVESAITIELKSSGIFLKQLQSKKLKSWIEKGLTKLWGKSVLVTTASRVGNKTPRVFEEPVVDYSPSYPTEEPVLPPAAPIEDHEPPSETELPPETSYEAPKIKEGEIFYGVYKQLPAELAAGTIPVIPSIPLAESKLGNTTETGDQDSNWDQEAEEIFEFE